MAKHQHQSPWIKVGDFLLTTYWISIHNLTTKTSLKASDEIQFSEAYENGIVLRLPRTTCALGHQLMLRIQKKAVQPLEDGPPTELIDEIEMTAKVHTIEVLDKVWNLVDIRFYQFSEDHWQKFLSDYAERQEKANSAVKAIRE